MANIPTAYFSDLNSNGLSDEEQGSGEVCLANISPFERKLRVQFAVRQFVTTLILLGVILALHLDPLWRSLLFFLFASATVSYMQARDKT